MNSDDSFREERLMIVNKIVNWKEHVFFPKETHTKFIENGPCKPWLYISVAMPALQSFPLQTISLHCFALILCSAVPTLGKCI